LLPTVLFIIVAYVLYALIVGWCRWQRFRLLEKPSRTRPRWLTLAGGVASLGLLFYVSFWMPPAAPNQDMRLANILGVAEGKAWLEKKGLVQKAVLQTPLQLDQRQPNGQPVYAILHPESPPILLPPAKHPVGIKHRRLKRKGDAARESRDRKLGPRLSKQDKSGKKRASGPSARKSRTPKDSTG
jgi:hypothetical protein